MILSIDVPNEISAILNSMKPMNKNRALSSLRYEINTIYHDTIGDIYGDKIFGSESQNYASIEDMYNAMHILINNGRELQVFLNDDIFETPKSPLNNEFESNLLGENIMNIYQQDNYKEDFTQLQVEFKTEIDNYLRNDFEKNINNKRGLIV